MSDDYKKIFAKNLSNLMARHKKTQADLVNDLNINKSTISTWINGTKMPRMNKIEMLANYFGVEKSDLIEKKISDVEQGYYTDPDAAEYAEYVKSNPNIRILFSAAKDVSKESLEKTVEYIQFLKSKERGDND